jgi:hypothetical protein
MGTPAARAHDSEPPATATAHRTRGPRSACCRVISEGREVAKAPLRLMLASASPHEVCCPAGETLKSHRGKTEALSTVRRQAAPRRIREPLAEEWELRCRPAVHMFGSHTQERHIPLLAGLKVNMGFRQRQRRRKRRAAQNAAQAASRSNGSAAGRWWLTICRLDTCCARCGHVLRVGVELVYRHTPRESLCVGCAQSDPCVQKSYRPSLAWERQRRAA